jgi:hypothetical protein
VVGTVTALAAVGLVTILVCCLALLALVVLFIGKDWPE